MGCLSLLLPRLMLLQRYKCIFPLYKTFGALMVVKDQMNFGLIQPGVEK